MEQKNVCGDCSLCCKLPPIFNKKQDDTYDFNSQFKQQGEWCVNCSTRKGCDIYEDRPQVCKDFMCFYAQCKKENINLEDEWHPKKSKFFITIENEAQMKENNITVYANKEHMYDLFTKQPFMRVVKNWLDGGALLIIHTDDKKTFGYQNVGGNYFEFIFENFKYGVRNKARQIPTQEIVFGRRH
tara:strand:- start:632 stop:1186 length:555 start_codon:yes stop_codon:yes gene_type:complete